MALCVRRLVLGARTALNLTVDLVTWAVFLVDFVVHLRIDRPYWRSGRGVFDWAMVSFTTVGYGHLNPTTAGGRGAGGLMTFMSLLALGRVSGVLASAFTEDRVGVGRPGPLG